MKTRASSRIGYYFARLAILLFVTALAVGTTGCPIDGIGEPTKISTWGELNAVRDNLDGSYVLTGHLDEATDGYDGLVGDTADGKGWQPLGTTANPFKGTFDGNGYVISDLFIYRPDEDEVGLFGRVQQGLVKNVGMVGVNVTGRKSVGALVGYNWKGTLNSDTRPPNSRTYSYGSVTGEEDVGGLVGNNYGGIVNQCQSSAEVFHLLSSTGEQRWRAGGLVGLNSGPVLNCNYYGEVNGDRQVGGLVGHNALAPDGRVEDCDGAYSVDGTSLVGGVAGLNLGTLRRNSYEGVVNGVETNSAYGLMALNEGGNGNAHFTDTALPGSYVGGVAGFSGGTVEDCSAHATVTGHQYVGGAIGGNQGNVTGCSSSGSVTGETDAGRLIGYNMDTGTVSDSSSTSCVTDAFECGDLVGTDEGAEVEYIELLSPADGSIGVPIIDITFAWTEAGADSYDWVLSENADLSSPLDFKTGLTSTVASYWGRLDYSTTYYWHVTAYVEGEWVATSAIGTFTTVSGLA